MNTSTLRGLTLATLLFTSACGSDPLPVAPKVTPPPQSQIAPAPPGATDDPNARYMIQQTLQAVRGLPAYSLEMRWFQKKADKTAEGVYDITGQAPRSTRVVIREGKNEGTKILFTGGKTARVRAAGILSAVALDLAVDSDRLKSVRGYTLAETDMKATMDMLGDPRHKSRVISQAPDGITMEVSGGPLLAGCVVMTAKVDPRTQLPMLIELRDSKEVVYHLEMKNFKRLAKAEMKI